MRLSSLLPILVAAFALSSCGSFERKWDAAVADYHSGKITGVEGPWAGSWTTNTNGHTGDLRAIVSESSKKPGEYDFFYHATWAKVFSGGYKVTYPGTQSGSTLTVDGKQKLGFFGTFRHKATITPTQFKATYSSEKGDLGDFSLTRPR